VCESWLLSIEVLKDSLPWREILRGERKLSFSGLTGLKTMVPEDKKKSFRDEER
jgi:hypothetical protein